MTNTKTAKLRTRGALLSCFSGLALAISGFALSGQVNDTEADVQSIHRLIATYATAVDRADAALAEQIWSSAPEVSFIHPRGEEHGRTQVEQNVYGHLMGDTFSERKLTVKDLSVHVYGTAAWSEFNWDFVATLRKDDTPFHSQGRETQVYHKEHGYWHLVHVHYSGMPVTEGSKGF